jgi:hypothetical protein
LVNDFGWLSFDLVLYIKMEFFPSIPEPLGLAVLLHIGRMSFSVVLEVGWVFLEPEFDAGVIETATIGVLLSPSGTVLSVQRLLAGRMATGFAPLPDSGIEGKKSLAIRTPFRSHPGFPLAVE